ncbi:ammonia-forming cytochrome c nitrite reductase [Desulfogranum mediterraneum]|uniref:ammonia-forming cytochrome c nitrite reductase n=1 Tax=Desulfogranum mediterraneum TaxID=160661 RepID=UPI00041C4C95|nr:ammonia-forming cytochrome c nitrite reductase [Desulfogranum mediterraneum]
MNRYKILLGGSLAALLAMGFMANSISGKQAEKEALNTTPVVKADGIESRNDRWAGHFPRQYDSWKKTKKSETIVDMLEQKPQLAILWAGYGFAKDYNAPRGHFYALQDNINTLRTGAPTGPDTGPMPTACWTCKSPDVPRVMAEEGENEFFTGKWARLGDQIVNPIGCGDCHDSKTTELTITRPHLLRALEASGTNPDDITYQEMRSLVCAQCHVEYYFKATAYTDGAGKEQVAKVVTLPWAKGLSAEAMEEYYDSYDFKDWTHKISKTPMLKAQHPGYELFKTGIHARRGVACADCHMPYRQEGAVKYSDHNVGNPLDNISNTCLTCHRESEEEFKSLVKGKLERKEQLMEIAMDNLGRAHLEAGKAWEVGANEAEMAPVLQLIRSAQWLWDYSIASHGSFYHAPEETLRLLSVANDKAQQARLKLVGVLAAHGTLNYQAPDFSTKQKAQQLAGVPLAKLVDAKMTFKDTLLKEWDQNAVQAGRLNPETRKGMSDISSYTR